MEILRTSQIFFKVLLFNLIYFSGSLKVNAQLFEWLSDDFPGSRFLNICEIKGKYYGAISNGAKIDFDPNTYYQLSIYEIIFNQPGEPGLFLNEIITIPFSDNFATNSIEYIEETKTWILVQSSVISDGLQTYKVLLYGENFNFITSSIKDTLGYPLPCQIDSYNGKTYILGSIQGPPMDELFYLEYNHSNPFYLPPIIVKQSEPRPMFYMTSMKIDPLNEDMLVFYYNGIAKLDTSLYQKQIYNYSQIRTSDHGTVLGTGTNYFSNGTANQGLGNGLRFLVLHKYDLAFNIIKADTFGIPNQDNYPFVIKSLDRRNGEILVGGHLDGPINDINVYNNIKKYFLAKYDENLNQIWYKEYGGDKAYWFSGVQLLEDGGSLAYGFVTDSIDKYRYAYIMHVDENGEILTSTTIPKDSEVSIKIVNPGDETLRILNPDHFEGRIELYDIQGCHVLTGEINDEVSEINTQDLPAGLYPYVLIHEGRAIGSGKWVKVK